MTGTGALSEDVASANFDLEMTGAIGKLVSCQGDASAAKTCSLPLGTGTLSTALAYANSMQERQDFEF